MPSGDGVDPYSLTKTGRGDAFGIHHREDIVGNRSSLRRRHAFSEVALDYRDGFLHGLKHQSSDLSAR